MRFADLTLQRYREKPLDQDDNHPRHSSSSASSAHLCGADGFAELARDAPFLAAGVAPERVLSAEARAKRSLLEGVVDGHFRLGEHLLSQAE